jgi:hypothetical protein
MEDLIGNNLDACLVVVSSKNVRVSDCMANKMWSDCFMPFAFKDTDNVQIIGGNHVNVGKPSRYLKIWPKTPPISVYTESVRSLIFNGVTMRMTLDVPSDYLTPHFYGLTYQTPKFSLYTS